MIGGSIVDEVDAPVGYVVVPYPFTMLPQYIAQAQSYKPKLFLMGEWDDYTSMDAFQQADDSMPEPEIVPALLLPWIIFGMDMKKI